MPLTPLYVRYMKLTIATQGGASQSFDFECDATSIGLVSSGGELSSLNTLCPAGSFSESAPRTWSLNITAAQDVENLDSLMLFLMLHEGETADVTWYPKTDNAKTPVGVGWDGVVILGVPSQVGGVEPGNYATYTVELPYQGKPTLIDAEGNPIEAITGVVAGTPGSFVPPGANPPADLNALKAHAIIGDTAYSGAAWNDGEYIELADESTAYWDGSAWVGGVAPAVLVSPAIVVAVAGTPGHYENFDGQVVTSRPANISALNGLGALGNDDEWATGEYIEVADESTAYWDGAEWVEGAAL